MTPAKNNCEGVKMGHWCLFPQNQFQCFKVEYLVISIIKEKSGNNTASGKY